MMVPAELIGTGMLVSEDRDLMLDQRMRELKNIVIKFIHSEPPFLNYILRGRTHLTGIRAGLQCPAVRTAFDRLSPQSVRPPFSAISPRFL